MPLFRILQRSVKSTHSYAETQGRNGYPAAVQDFQRLDKSLTFVAQSLRLVNAAVLKDHLGGLRGSHTKLVLLPSGLKPGSAPFHDESCHPMGVALFTCSRYHYRHVAGDPVRNEVLSTVENVMVAIANRHGVHVSCIGSRVGFSKSPRTDQLTGCQAGQILLTLLFVTEGKDVVRAQRVVGGHRKAYRPVDLGDRLESGDVLQIAKPRTSIFLRYEHAHQAE